MTIPFLDLVTPHLELEEELVSVFHDALRTGGFVGGSMVQTFEREFASYCDVPHSVGVASGTDALRLALIAAGVKPGETVVTVPNTFIATTEAISQAGTRPDFVDVDERTHTLDAGRLRRYLEAQCTRDSNGQPVCKRTGTRLAAVIPVHLYGQMADMDPILEIADENDLVVIEDACQAHGAEYFSRRAQRWCRAGSMGHAAAFSFYPGKNLGACGEAGAVTTGDESIARRVRMLREHGQSKKYCHDMEGYNGRLDAIQAGILSVKLRHLDRWNSLRCAAALVYNELFRGESGVVVPHVPEWSRPVNHLYVVQVEDRDAVQRCLTDAQIGTGIHYPVPLHLSPAYSELGFRRGDFPVAERITSRILSLPMFPNLSREAQREVVALVLSVARRHSELPA